MKATSETVFFVTIERIFFNIFFLFFSFLLLLPLPPRFSAEYTFCCGRQSGAGREGGREGREGLVRGKGRTLHVICFVIGAWEGGY